MHNSRRTKTRILLFFIIGSSFLCILNSFPQCLVISAQPDGIVSSNGGETVLTDLFKKVRNSVVTIHTENATSAGSGSGFVFDDQGHIVTNNHVTEGGSIFDVIFLDGNAYSAQLIGNDKYADLAVLKLEGNAISKQKPQPLPLGNSSNLQVGQQVVAVGNPFGEFSGSMTFGIVSQIGRTLLEPNLPFGIPNAIQTDAVINPGNSGGPLFNLAGEVIGVNTASRIGAPESVQPVGVGISFAIPSDTVKKIIPVLISDGSYKHPWFGAYIVDVTTVVQRELDLPEAKGVAVMEVTAGSPAERSGIQPRDVILAVDGKQVRTSAEFSSSIEEKSVGDTMMVDVYRDGSRRELQAELIERPEQFIIRPPLAPP